MDSTEFSKRVYNGLMKKMSVIYSQQMQLCQQSNPKNLVSILALSIRITKCIRLAMEAICTKPSVGFTGQKNFFHVF